MPLGELNFANNCKISENLCNDNWGSIFLLYYTKKMGEITSDLFRYQLWKQGKNIKFNISILDPNFSLFSMFWEYPEMCFVLIGRVVRDSHVLKCVHLDLICGHSFSPVKNDWLIYLLQVLLI